MVMRRRKFCIHLVYAQLVSPQPKVSWRGLICNNRALKRAKFIVWLLAQNTLPIMDRLSKWGISLVIAPVSFAINPLKQRIICF